MDITPINILSSPDPLAATQFPFYEITQYITGLYLYPVICTVGILGSILAICIFSQHKLRRSTTNAYLSALAVSDLCKLLNDFIYFCSMLELRRQQTKLLYIVYYPYGYFFSQYFASTSAWLVMSVATERWLMVAFPLWCRSLLTLRKAKMVCVAVYLFLFVFNLPCLFRYEQVTIVLDSPQNFSIFDITCNNISCAEVQHELNSTALWQTRFFVQVYPVLHSLLRNILPLMLIVLLNGRIIFSLHRSRIHHSASGGRHLQPRNRVTIMLIAVIAAFIFLSTPDVVLTLLGWGYHEADHDLHKGLREIADTLLTLNSAVNFFLYAALNKVFRIHLRALFFFHSPGQYQAAAQQVLFTSKKAAHGHRDGGSGAQAEPTDDGVSHACCTETVARTRAKRKKGERYSMTTFPLPASVRPSESFSLGSRVLALGESGRLDPQTRLLLHSSHDRSLRSASCWEDVYVDPAGTSPSYGQAQQSPQRPSQGQQISSPEGTPEIRKTPTSSRSLTSKWRNTSSNNTLAIAAHKKRLLERFAGSAKSKSTSH